MCRRARELRLDADGQTEINLLLLCAEHLTTRNNLTCMHERKAPFIANRSKLSPTYYQSFHIYFHSTGSTVVPVPCARRDYSS